MRSLTVQDRRCFDSRLWAQQLQCMDLQCGSLLLRRYVGFGLRRRSRFRLPVSMRLRRTLRPGQRVLSGCVQLYGGHFRRGSLLQQHVLGLHLCRRGEQRLSRQLPLALWPLLKSVQVRKRQTAPSRGYARAELWRCSHASRDARDSTERNCAFCAPQRLFGPPSVYEWEGDP